MRSWLKALAALGVSGMKDDRWIEANPIPVHDAGYFRIKHQRNAPAGTWHERIGPTRWRQRWYKISAPPSQGTRECLRRMIRMKNGRALERG